MAVKFSRYFMRLVQQRSPGEERDDVDAAGFDGLATAFLAVYEDDAELDVGAFFFDDVDGFERGAASGDDIIDDDDVLAGGEISLDLLAAAVAFWLFADGEDLDGLVRVVAGGGHADGEGDGVCAKGHASDGLDGEVFRVNFGTHGVPSEVANHSGAEGIEGGDAAVDVEVGLFPRGEGEVASTDGFLEEEGFEIGCGLEHWGRMNTEHGTSNPERRRI